MVKRRQYRGTISHVGRDNVGRQPDLLLHGDSLLCLVDLAVQLCRSVQRLAVVVPLRNDLVDDLDRGSSSSLGLPANRSVHSRFRARVKGKA